MSGLRITVTDAGHAALVNADNTGTAPVLVAEIGVTDQAIDRPSTALTLPGELKRLATFAGVAVAADTVHVTIRDDSTDVYSLRGFGLYLADGTLFALYGQADPILEKSAQAMLLLAADVRFVQIDATNLAFGDTDWANPPATTGGQGVIELATDAEALAGVDAQRGLVPAALKHVLDTRFGAGAPSAFVKGLLNLATAALFRAALEIKSAALKDEGAGNGLDADKLDGQHGVYYRAWSSLTGKPSTFAPSAHGHAWGEISSVPAQASRWPSWGEVTGKPSTFTPSGHSHDAGNIVSGTLAVARVPDLPISKISELSNTLTRKLESNAPANFWSGETSLFIENCGWIGTNGAYATSIYNNGYRNESGGFTYIDGGRLGAAGIDILSDVFYWRVGSAGSATAPPIRMSLSANSFAVHVQTALENGLSVRGTLDSDGIIYTSDQMRIGSPTDGGQVRVIPGSVDYPGYVEFRTQDEIRRGYIGHGAGTSLLLGSENGWNWAFGATPSVNGDPIWHAGNDGEGSGLNADVLRGRGMAQSSIGNTVVERTSSADICARLFRSGYPDQDVIGGAMAFRSSNSTDDFIRFCDSPSAIRAFLNTPESDRLLAAGFVGGAASRPYMRHDDSTIVELAPINNPTFTGTVTAPLFSQSSSRRYKRDIADIDPASALAMLRNAAFKTYTMRADGSFAAGVVAEDLADGPLDFAVIRTDDGAPDSVNYQPLFVMACAALQGIADRVAALESRA